MEKKINQNGVFVEIVAKKKGCMLCDLAIGILEEISPEFSEGALRWEVVDVGTREGLHRFDDLTKTGGRRPSQRSRPWRFPYATCSSAGRHATGCGEADRRWSPSQRRCCLPC